MISHSRSKSPNIADNGPLRSPAPRMTTSDNEIAAPPSKPASWLSRLAGLAAWLVLAATLAGFGGRWWWALGLAAPFRVQLVMACVAILVVLLLLRWRRRAAERGGWPLAAALAALLINAALVLPFWLASPQPSHDDAIAPLTVMAFNLNYGNHRLDEVADAGPIAQAIEASGADIVVIAEVTMHRLGVLRRSLPGYRMAAGQGRPDPFGIALFVKHAVETGDEPLLRVHHAAVIELTNGMTSVPQVELHGQWAGRPVSVLGLHTVSAVHARSDRFRVAMMAGAAAWANRQRGQGRAVIICGDFNATPWCPPYVDLMTDADLLNSMSGFGAAGSWPAPLPRPLRISIDHCLHSHDLVTIRRELGDTSHGSDHLPLTVQLRWRTAGAASASPSREQ